MKTKVRLLVPALAFVLSFPSIADVPHLMHHQGILQNNGGQPYNGPAEFKFAFVNQDGSLSFWSNDGTSIAGSEPGAAIALPVSDGLFNVQLGDTDLGMQALPPGVFAGDQVYLRTWVDGELLTPDRRVTSVGFAMQAATVAEGAITPGSIPPNTITSGHIVDHSVGSDDLVPDIALETLRLEHNGTKLTEFSAAMNSPILNFWDAFGTPTTSLGDLLGGGRLNLFQINGKPGVKIDGDAATYQNNGSAGGEITVHDAGGNIGAKLDGVNDGGARLELRQAGSLTPFIDALALADNGGAKLVVRGDKGVNGVEIFGQGDLSAADPRNPDGGPAPGAGQIKLYQPGGLGAVLYGSAKGGGGALSLRNTSGDTKFIASGGPDVGSLQLANSSGQITVEMTAADGEGNGLIRTQVLEITGGSDLAEQFNINAVDLKPEPGMLVSIDPANPGELVVSTTAYDRTAAGVISGAGGVNPGMMMGQAGSIADGDHPVALTGRVFCHVDAGYGAIEPGDLITTSPTPGHGMKVGDHERAQGAIVGKAMTGLSEGRGMVLVLVSLQ